MEETQKAESSPGPDNSKGKFDTFEVWKEYEKIAMHFNDLLLRLRTQAIGGVAAIATIAGIIIKGDINADLRHEVLTGCFFFLIVFWIAVWIIDLGYYNKLLLGSVKALLEVEKASKLCAPLDMLSMSTEIEAMFSNEAPFATQNQKQRASLKVVKLYYGLVFIALSCGLIFSVGELCGCW